MRLLLIILLLFFIPIPIKLNIYYSNINYFIKLYNLTIISKTKSENKSKKSAHKEKHEQFSNFNDEINLKTLLLDLHNTNLKFKPLLRIKFDFSYSFTDAARTAISYGVLYQFPPLIYKLLGFLFKVSKFNYKITPIFEDKFLVKIEISSIIFLSVANIIYITIILFRCILKQRR
jgi:hypothetical protein